MSGSLGAARKQAERDLADLPWRSRARLYLSGGNGVERWLDRRSAAILSRQLDDLRRKRFVESGL